MENRVRSLAKAITFRIAATFVTTLLVFLFTGSVFISASVGFLEFMLKILLYYLHERVWNILSFGREKSTIDLARVHTRVTSLKDTSKVTPEGANGTKPKSR